MPTVQKAERRVSRAGYPGANLTAAETATSQGAGLEQARANVAGAIAGLGAQGVQIGSTLFYRAEAEKRQQAEEAKRRADRLAVIDAESRLAAEERDYIYKPGTGVLARQGEDALGAPEEVRAWFDKSSGEIESKLANDEQKAAFHAVRAGRGQQIDMTIARHVDGEMNKVFAKKTEAAVDTHTDLAIANVMDPTRASIEMRSAEQAITVAADALGWSKEQKEATIIAAQSKVALGQIDYLIEAGDTKRAQVLFEEAKSAGLLGNKIGSIEKALAGAKVKKTSQQEAERILATNPNDIEAQRAAAKQIDDADVQDATMQRIEHEWSVKKAVDQETERKTLIDVANTLDRSRNVAAVPVKVWSNLEPGQRSAFRSYVKQLTEAGEVVNNPVEYYRLRSMAVDPDPKVREQFKALRLTDKINVLGKTQFETLVDLQASMKGGDIKAETRIADGFLTNDQIVKNKLLGAGIDSTPDPLKNPEQAKSVADFYAEVDRQVRGLNKEKPTNAEIEKIVDDLLVSKVSQKGGGWLAAFPGGQPVYDQQKRQFEILAEIPAAKRQQIEAALRAAGKATSTTNIVQTWMDAPPDARK